MDVFLEFPLGNDPKKTHIHTPQMFPFDLKTLCWLLLLMMIVTPKMTELPAPYHTAKAYGFQEERGCPVNDQNPHLVNIGRMVEVREAS